MECPESLSLCAFCLANPATDFPKNASCFSTGAKDKRKKPARARHQTPACIKGEYDGERRRQAEPCHSIRKVIIHDFHALVDTPTIHPTGQAQY